MTAVLRFELRRAGQAGLWTTPGVLVAGGVAVAVTAAGHGNYHPVAGTVLAALLPLGAAMATASVLGAETATELHLSLPVSCRATLARRMLLVLAAAAVLDTVGTLGAAVTGLWTSGHGAGAQLVWLAPTLALVGLAVLLAAAAQSAGVAAGVVGGIWVGQQAYKAWFAAHSWTHPLFLFPDVRAGVVPAADWATNRLTLVLIGLACLTAAWLLLADPERLLHDDTSHRSPRRGGAELMANPRHRLGGVR